MKWIRTIAAVLAEESELWLAYLHGQQLLNIPRLTATRPRHSGLLRQVVKFFVTLAIDTHCRQPQPLSRPTTYLFFAATINQQRSLESTASSLGQRGARVIVLAEKNLLKGNDSPGVCVVYLALSPLDAVRSMVLFFTRAYRLYLALKALHPVAAPWYFSDFCSTYKYLPYFFRILNQLQPGFVVVANDHNPANRCLMALSHQMGIKTVYLQHASVSAIFPALNVDYAFLDGQCALDTYRLCKNHSPHRSTKQSKPVVILSGQKKQVVKIHREWTPAVGVAFNKLDDIEEGIRLVCDLSESGFKVHLRWHPGQSKCAVARLKRNFHRHIAVRLSDPKRESVSTFLEHIRWVIAGNSNILLEAAIVGICCIYYELTQAEFPDYYGFVGNGIARQARSLQEIIEILQDTDTTEAYNMEAVRYYSSTYMSDWEGREGELVADCLECIRHCQKLPVPYHRL